MITDLLQGVVHIPELSNAVVQVHLNAHGIEGHDIVLADPVVVHGLRRHPHMQPTRLGAVLSPDQPLVDAPLRISISQHAFSFIEMLHQLHGMATSGGNDQKYGKVDQNDNVSPHFQRGMHNLRCALTLPPP